MYVYVCIYEIRVLNPSNLLVFFAWLTNELLSSPYFSSSLLIIFVLILKKLFSFIIFINIKVVIEFL